MWDAEIRYSQGKEKAQVYTPKITIRAIPVKFRNCVREYIGKTEKTIPSMNKFQAVFCMTAEKRMRQKYDGPFELLEKTKAFIEKTLSANEQQEYVLLNGKTSAIPLAIAVGYLILKRITACMGRKS